MSEAKPPEPPPKNQAPQRQPADAKRASVVPAAGIRVSVRVPQMASLFRGHYRPSDAQFQQLWEQAFFAFDANVLLGVYRYTAKTRKSLFSVLEGLRERLWLPHQAALEFQRNRIDTILGERKRFMDFEALLGQKLLELSRHSFLTEEEVEEIEIERDDLLVRLERARERQKDFTADDPLRRQVDALFDGKVGAPFPGEEVAERERQAKLRIDQQMPPGYKDAKKPESRKLGDALMWFQLIEEGKHRKTPLLFVTDDAKEDWWEIHEGNTQGPRPELTEEFWRETEQAFYMYRTDSFLEYGRNFLKLTVDQSSVDEVRERQAEASLSDILNLHRYPTSAGTIDDANTWWSFFPPSPRISFPAGTSPDAMLFPEPGCTVLRALLRAQRGTAPLSVLAVASQVLAGQPALPILQGLERLGFLTDCTPDFRSGRLSATGIERAKGCGPVSFNLFPTQQ
jgi:hypothetical protein